jgi:hypothetical protein
MPAADHIVGLCVSDRWRPWIRFGWIAGWAIGLGVLMLVGVLPWEPPQHGG